MQVGGDEDKEEGAKDVGMEGQAEGSGAAEGDDKMDASNGGLRRDGNQRMLRRVVSCGSRFWVLNGAKMVLIGCRIIIHFQSLPQGSFPKVRMRNW
jgi:hypothetical protein